MNLVVVAEYGQPDKAEAPESKSKEQEKKLAQQLIESLAAPFDASKYRDAWLNLLPVGGEDGTLSRRLCCMSGGTGIRAKTGSLSRALALSGYADSKTRGRLAFSILVNDFAAPQNEVRAWIDKIATALLE